jgi:hypothetical protein
MSELYWITRFDGFLTAVILMLVACLVLAIIFIAGYFDSYDEDTKKANLKRSITFGSIGIFLLIAQIFIPTTKQALVIYGVGGTIDYIKSNETAKQLPDKVVMALDKYLDTINKEEEAKKE